MAAAILETYREVIEVYWKEKLKEPGPIIDEYADSVI